MGANDPRNPMSAIQQAEMAASQQPGKQIPPPMLGGHRAETPESAKESWLAGKIKRAASFILVGPQEPAQNKNVEMPDVLQSLRATKIQNRGKDNLGRPLYVCENIQQAYDYMLKAQRYVDGRYLGDGEINITRDDPNYQELLKSVTGRLKGDLTMKDVAKIKALNIGIGTGSISFQDYDYTHANRVEGKTTGLLVLSECVEQAYKEQVKERLIEKYNIKPHANVSEFNKQLMRVNLSSPDDVHKFMLQMSAFVQGLEQLPREPGAGAASTTELLIKHLYPEMNKQVHAKFKSLTESLGKTVFLADSKAEHDILYDNTSEKNMSSLDWAVNYAYQQKWNKWLDQKLDTVIADLSNTENDLRAGKNNSEDTAKEIQVLQDTRSKIANIRTSFRTKAEENHGAISMNDINSVIKVASEDVIQKGMKQVKPESKARRVFTKILDYLMIPENALTRVLTGGDLFARGLAKDRDNPFEPESVKALRTARDKLDRITGNASSTIETPLAQELRSDLDLRAGAGG